PAAVTASGSIVDTIRAAPAVMQAALHLYAAGIHGRQPVGPSWSDIDPGAGCVLDGRGAITLTPAAVEALRVGEHGGAFLSLPLGRHFEQTVHMTTDSPMVFARWTDDGWLRPLAFGDA